MRMPFRPLGNRVVIQADREDRAPGHTESGLVLATTLAAAVEGHDPEDSWCVGTVVGLGPLVNQFNVRPWLRATITALMDSQEWRAHRLTQRLASLRQALDAAPAECPDPVRVGDRAVFSWAAGQQLTVDGERYLLLRADEVLAILDDEEEEGAHAG